MSKRSLVAAGLASTLAAGSAPVMLQGSGPGFRNLPVFAPEDETGSGGGADFMSTLSDDNKALATEQGWSDAGAVFDGFRNLQGKLNNTVALPGQDATPEQHAEFYSELSKTWTPEGDYTFNMPENLPENFAYDQDFAKEAGSWFKEAGLPTQAAQVLHDKWVSKMAEAHTESETAATEAATKQAEAMDTAHRALVSEYGEVESDGYKNVVAKADRAQAALKEAGIDVSSWFAEKGILTEPDDKGLQQVTDATAVKLLAFIQDKAFSEDGLNGLGDGGDGSNPFDSEKPNLQKQSELLDSNPARAKQLIEAANRDPKLFGL
ncbi:MAG: hypothetical protein JJ939_15805 [Alphaproteobacteria bacterium]|nr:hypothetical protein [Alphaproteobacteria bacterium]